MVTLVCKVTQSILQHIDVREERKENCFSIGKALWIGAESFEDLDEIIARHIQPMAAFARDLTNYKSFRALEAPGVESAVETLLLDDKRRAPSKIPYFLTASAALPGKFLLSYLPRKTTKHEYVTVTPDGMRYRGHVFHTLSGLIKWFKEHFRDPVPGTPLGPVGLRTPLGTPSLQGIDPAAIQRAAQGMPPNVYQTLQQVSAAAQRTPYSAGGGYAAAYPGLSTPMMTPGQSMGPPIGRPPGAMRTPAQYETPRPGYPPTTPLDRSPRDPSAGRMPPMAAPPRSQPKPAAPPASEDWAKRAQLWAQQKAKAGGGQGTPRRTPAGGPSPYRTPGGDQTPLVDEDR